MFINNTTYVACGYDKVPYLFKKEAKGWTFSKVIDEGINSVRAEAQITKGSFEES